MDNNIFTNLIDEFLLSVREIIREEIIRANESTLIKSETKERYLSARQVAPILKITERTVAVWALEGKLKAYRIGRRIFYKESELSSGMRPMLTVEEKNGMLKDRAKKDRDTLNPSYIKKQISKDSKYQLKAKDIPLELVELKTSSIALKREIENQNL